MSLTKKQIREIESLPSLSERMDAYKAAGIDPNTKLPIGDKPKAGKLVKKVTVEDALQGDLGLAPPKTARKPRSVKPDVQVEAPSTRTITKVEELKNEPAPTVRTYGDIQQAFDHFNRELFAGKLPHVLVTLTRKKNARGYFWADRFALRNGENVIHEIALNPEADTMLGRTDREVLSTLVHEMCHLEQQVFGKPGKGGYHNPEWGTMMDAVGLTPQACIPPSKGGGLDPEKRTGTKVSHVIVEGGPFALSYDRLRDGGFELGYMERRFTEKEKVRAKAKKASKTKFICAAGCEDSVCWAKPSFLCNCGSCGAPLEPEDKEGDLD